MFEDIAALIHGIWHYIFGWLQLTFETARNINPSQPAVLWVQLAAGTLTVIWIVFQFAWLRRLNEARLERYLEDRIITERDDLAQERSETLAKLDRITRRRGFTYALLLAWAHKRKGLRQSGQSLCRGPQCPKPPINPQGATSAMIGWQEAMPV